MSRSSTGTETETEAERAKEEESPADPPAVTSIDPQTLTFDVLKQTHVRANLGFTVSGLESPTFDTREKDIAASADGTTPAQKEITIFRATGEGRQVRPAAHFSLHIVPEYYFAESDPTDPTEGLRSYQRYMPYPTFGFALTDTTENYFLGGGIDLARGISILGGWHFGKVARLVNGYKEDEAFVVPATPSFDLKDVTETSYRNGWYFSLSMDATSLRKLFGAAAQ